jgi:hypothetical protein
MRCEPADASLPLAPLSGQIKNVPCPTELFVIDPCRVFNLTG